ncbi:MAG TPA: ATP-binding protein, partial [Gemmatimonadaceae bacterium]|nr:ATP-binding protein [Gemmatimonadaceae bacterium]
MRLVHRLLLGSLLVVGVLVVLVVTLLDRRLHTRLLEESRQGLTREASLVASQWTPAVASDVLADAAGAALGHRVTLVDSAGVVEGDSEFDGPALARLQNHARRPEIVQARDSGVGYSRRVSPSAGDDEIYVAVRAARGFARVSMQTRSMEEIFDRARQDVYGAGFVALLAALGLSVLFARSVSRPIVELRDVATALAAGDLTRRPALSAPGEVGDLANATYRLAEQLGSRLAALEAEESLSGALFDALNEGAFALNAQHAVVRINNSGRRLLGVRAAVPFSADLLPRERTLREALAAAMRGSATEPVELALGDRTLLLTARPLAGGGAVLALLDLTPVRRLEAVRRDFVANVSHELRTPLTIVSGFAETLDEDHALPEEQRRHFVRTIRANATRMQRIVDDLLDLSRIESGGWVPNPTRVDTRAAAVDAMAPCRADAEKKGLRLDVEVPLDAATLDADPTAVRQVLANLVENAVRHTASGSVTVFGERGEGGVWIGVRDTGSGIPAEHLPRVFERFYRVDAARSRAQGGTGLGLSIVRHLVEAHGGRVRAESQVG